MKNRIYTLALSALMIVFMGACADRLDLDPFNAVGTDNAFQSAGDFSNAVRGMYSGMRAGDYYGGRYIATPDILSDNLIICSEGRLSQQTTHYWNYGGNNTWLLWDDGYRIILRANLILENIDALEDGAFKNNVMGEALAIRALAHFDMARLYCPAPQHAPTALGIPYMTSSDASQKPSRPPVTETFNLIIQDLEDAAALISDDNGEGRLNQVAVNGLLARVNFYAGDNAGAIAAATAVIDDPNAPAVATAAQFDDLWKDGNAAGVLFKMKITNQDGTSPGVQYSQTGAEGVRSEYVADYAFYTEYENSAEYTGDVRLDVYFQTSDFAGETFNHIAKWFGRTGAPANLSDVQVLRMEEIYLTRAEARALTNQAGALADLNVVRDQRYTSYTGGETGAALLAAIRLERRKELAFEGHRFFDIKRMNVGISRSTFGDYADGSGGALPSNALNLPAGDGRFSLPLPQSELNANSNMEQNPGY